MLLVGSVALLPDWLNEIPLSALAAIGLPGSRGFLVDSITYCGGPSPSSIGCAQTPACDGNANDDPNLWLVVTMDASDSGLLGGVVAHERGHNACLVHVNVDECQIMRPAAGGACLSAGECANFQAGRTTTGGTCTCHDDASPPAADGATCSGVAGGVCSGAICGDPMSDAGVALLEAGQDKAARPYSSMAKTHVARALCKVLDDAIQMHGGLGYSEDVPFSRWYRTARAARIADGPDEVHEMVIARDTLLGRLDLLV